MTGDLGAQPLDRESTWLREAKFDPKLASSDVSFSETALMLAAAEGGQGLGIARMTLVADALVQGTLVRPFGPDGIRQSGGLACRFGAIRYSRERLEHLRPGMREPEWHDIPLMQTIRLAISKNRVLSRTEI